MGVFSEQKFGASGALGKISKWLENPNADSDSKIWNYGRYAYITLSTNGLNNAGLCASPAGITLGDTTLNSSDTYQSLISRDGERDIPSKPILDSVRISNDGSTDMSDAALFDIDVSFKCYSAAQFATYENAFFKVGTGVNLKFGYKDLYQETKQSKANPTAGLGGSMTANVYNFSFSLDASGVYSCNMKLTGKNRFAAVLTIKQELSEEGTEVVDKDGNTIKAKGIIGELNARFINAFPNFEESSMVSRTPDFVPDGEAVHNGGYAVANIQTKSGGDASALGITFDFDDMFVKYCTFQELVNVLNKAHSKSGFSWGFGPATGAVIPQFGSADPAILLLDGEMANYGEDGNGDTKNDLQTGVGFAGDAATMLISIDFVAKLLNDLAKSDMEDKESKGATSVNNFLRVLCENIKDLTGGLYQLTLYNDGFGDSGVFLIVNERTEHELGIEAAYTFTLHNKGSVLKSVSMQSNFDSDLAAAALVSNRSGEVPKDALDNLYSECGGVVDEKISSKDVPTTDEIKEKKEQIGLGISPERVQEFKDVMASYVSNQPKKTKTDSGYRYMIDLSVSTYGVWGTQIGHTFTFDGVPDKYKGKGKYFCVGKMEHTFDGQGNWETSFTGFLKIDATKQS